MEYYKVPPTSPASSVHEMDLGQMRFTDCDDNQGSDITIALESVIRNLEELCLKVSVVPKPESKLPSKYHKTIDIEFELKKEYPYYFLLRRTEKSSHQSSRAEQINNLLRRLQILEEFYNLLLDSVSFTVDNLKSMYDPKLYDIIISKRTEEVALLQEKTATRREEPEGLDKYPQAESTKKYHILPEEPKEFKSTQEVSIPPDTSTDKNAIHEPIPLTKEFVHPEPVKEETTKENPLPLNHKKHDTLETKKRKLSSMQPLANKKQDTKEYPIVVDNLSNLLIIGPNGTTIKQHAYEGLQLKTAPGATRLLCDLIFGDEILATHSLTGNQSPAFRGRERPLKKQLDPLKTADITHLVCSKFNVNPQLVRSTITTKCADSTKKLKRLSIKSI